MASCNLRNFGPCLSQFGEIELFLRNLTDFVKYNKPYRIMCSKSPTFEGWGAVDRTHIFRQGTISEKVWKGHGFSGPPL